MLNFIFGSLGVPQALAKFVSGLPVPPWVIMALIIGFYLALGTFMEGFSMIVTTIPVIFPVVKALGYDPIWFGVIVTMLVEIALISPPDGTVLYVLQGMRGTPGPITDVFRGVIPFIVVYVLAIVILMVAPELALWLPRPRPELNHRRPLPRRRETPDRSAPAAATGITAASVCRTQST